MATILNNRIFFDFPVVEEKSEYENLKTKIKSLSPFFIEVKEGVSKSFSIEIKAYAPRNGNCLNVNDLNSLLNQNIRVLVTQSNNKKNSDDAYTRAFGGILTSYKNKFIGTDLVVYTLFIESKLSNLSVAFNNETHRFVRQNEVRFYQNTEVKSVLEDIVLNSTFDKPTFNRNFISVSDDDFKYLSHLFFIQDNESYQEFLDKICIYYGVNYNLSFMIDVGSNDLGDINSFVENYALRENINLTTSNDLCVSDQVYKVTFGKDTTGTSTPIFNNSSDESSKINCSFSNANKDLLRDETNDPYLLTDCENNFLSKEINSSINLSLNNSLDVLIKSTIIHQKIKYEATTNDSYVDTELKLRQKNFENLIESLSFTQIFNDLNNLAFACGKVITLDKENYLIARNSFYFYIDNFDNLDDKTRTANNAAHESLSTLLGNDLKNNEIHQSILTIPVNEKDNFGYLGILPLLEVDDSNYADKILNIDFGSYFTKNNSYLREFEAIVCDDSGDYDSRKGEICVESSEDSLGYASTCYAYVGTYNKGVDKDNKSIDEKIVIPVECVFKDENNFPVIGQKIIVSRNNGEFVFNKYSKQDVINEGLVLSRDLRNDLLNSGRLYHRNDNKNYDFNDYNVRSGSFDVTHFSSFKSYLEYLIIEGQISDYVSNLTKLNGESKYLDHYKKGDDVPKVEIFPFSKSGFEFYSECSDGTIAYVEVDNLYVDVKTRYSDDKGKKEDKTGDYYKYTDKESKKEKVYKNENKWYKKNGLDTVEKSDYEVDKFLKKYIYIDGEELTADSTSLKNYCSGVSKAYKALQKDSAHTISRVDLSKDLSNAVTYVYDLVLTAVYLGLDRKGLYNNVFSYAKSKPTSSIYKNSNEIFIKTSDGDLNITSGNNLVINSDQKLTINAKSIELKGTDSIKLKTGGSSITLEPRELNLKQIGTASPFIEQMEGDGDWQERLSRAFNALTGFVSNASLSLSGNDGATLSGYKANIKGMLSASVKDSFGASLQAKVGAASLGGMKATVSTKMGEENKIELVLDIVKKAVNLIKGFTQVFSTGETYDETVNAIFGSTDLLTDGSEVYLTAKDSLTNIFDSDGHSKGYQKYKEKSVNKTKKDVEYYGQTSEQLNGLTPFAIAHSALESVIKVMEDVEDLVLEVVIKAISTTNSFSNNIIVKFDAMKNKDDSDAVNDWLETISYVAVRIFSLMKYVTAYVWLFALKWSSPVDKVCSKFESIPSKISFDAKYLSTTALKKDNGNSPASGVAASGASGVAASGASGVAPASGASGVAPASGASGVAPASGAPADEHVF